jgi:tetratricopeptide (TPR) repeat protein
VLLGLQEKWDQAADAYRKALAINPLHAQAHNNLGQILERQRLLEAAMSEYRAAVDSQPTLRIARFNLGRMFIALGRLDQAIFASALTEPLDEEAPRYLFGLAAAHLRAGHKAEAREWALKAKALAIQFGQHDLAAIIERDLASIK